MPQKNKSRKRRAGPDSFAAKVDGAPIKVEIDEFPGLLFSFDFDPPGLVMKRALTEAFAGRVTFTHLPGFPDRMANLNFKHRVKEEVSLAMPADATDLGRMLAKIGHAYAVAEIGLGSFRPYLLDIILNRPPLHIGHYVGGFGHAPAGSDLHDIRIEPDFWGPESVAIEIQLFAARSMPTYVVIVGERVL
jgi:hypothetical protein